MGHKKNFWSLKIPNVWSKDGSMLKAEISYKENWIKEFYFKAYI